MATINRKARQFTDINLAFGIHPVTSDINKKTDEEAVKASIKHLILTRNYERPFHPEIGCQIHGLLFENFTPTIKQVLKKTILDVIEKFEPRARVLDVIIHDNTDRNDITIDVIFKLVNAENPIKLTTSITRVR